MQAFKRTLFVHLCGTQRRWYCKKAGTQLPDYNTSVEVHTHKLSRPDRPPGSGPKTRDRDPKWWGQMDLQEANKSLIPETLSEMAESEDFKTAAANLKVHGQVKLTREERKKRQRSLDQLGIPSFNEFRAYKMLQENKKVTEPELRKRTINLLQLNIGLYCNMACNHCHVESSPKRREMMDRVTADRCLHVLKNSPAVHTLDLTGGAPELCDEFQHLAAGGRALQREVIVRSNLTALLEPGQESTAKFFADQGLQVIASLPSYSAKNTNIQRGKGAFNRSIQGLNLLNDLGYGREGSGLTLNLVYNPLGAFLPPPQAALEEKFKAELQSTFGITFNHLYTMVNMPVKRFADFLWRRNELYDYMDLLTRNYNVDTIDKLMCRRHLSVGWDGRLYDCDFNQQLAIGVSTAGKGLTTVFDVESTADLEGSTIPVDNHCYGCTAAMGSS